MSALIGTIIGLVVLVLGWVIYGIIVGMGKKGGEHIYENRDKYKDRMKSYWNNDKKEGS